MSIAAHEKRSAIGRFMFRPWPHPFTPQDQVALEVLRAELEASGAAVASIRGRLVVGMLAALLSLGARNAEVSALLGGAEVELFVRLFALIGMYRCFDALMLSQPLHWKGVLAVLGGALLLGLGLEDTDGGAAIAVAALIIPGAMLILGARLLTNERARRAVETMIALRKASTQDQAAWSLPINLALMNSDALARRLEAVRADPAAADAPFPCRARSEAAGRRGRELAQIVLNEAAGRAGS